MNQFKKFLVTFAAFAAVLCVIIASAGAMNSGKCIYIVCGILNLANIYPVVKFAVKILKNLPE